MAAVQAEDVRASCLFVGDLNGHNRDWLGCTNRHKSSQIVMVSQPLTLQLCLVAISWLSVRHMHVVEHLTLLMTDVPDLVRVSVVTPIGNSDHSSL